MVDRVFVHGLEVECTIGIAEWERNRRQRLLVDLEVEVDSRPAAASDDVGCAVDYATLARLARETAEASPVRLVETLAERLAQALLQRFDAVEVVRVRIVKGRAVPGAANVGVEIARRREEAGR